MGDVRYTGFLANGWTGAIDAVVVSSGLQSDYVMDDFSFQGPSQVPESGTLALVLAGLAWLAALHAVGALEDQAPRSDTTALP